MEDLNYLAEFHDHLKKAKIILAYDGVLSKDIVAAFLTRLKIDIEKTSVPKKEKKRFFSIVVECIQNLSKHGTVSELSDAHFLVLVEKENSTLKISTGNVVKNETQETIQALINNVNNKNKSELREMYKNGISKNVLTKKGEASLGLIDIARKSNQKLKYQFKKIDNNTSFFIFQTQIHILS
ncbi:MAG: SiaB family protein kinase [Crocinitomix sp.]|nr:SiaB family protein kinase [Crocinitomix sp.]